MEYLYAVKAMDYARKLASELVEIEMDIWRNRLQPDRKRELLDLGMAIESEISAVERIHSWVTN